VNIITQSGGNEYHGSIYGFARPSAFEAIRRQADDTRVNKQGNLLHEENYDVGADLGGYVPGLRDKLFFFGSFNPTVRREIVTGVRANAADIGAGNEGIVNSGLFTQRGEFARRYRTYNYAGKLDWVVNPNHQFTFSIFGDPTKTNLSSFAFLNIDNNSADSVLDYGTRNWAFRYNGSLSPTWTINSSFSQGKSHFNETGFADVNQIAIRNPIDPIRGNYTAVGRGFFEPTESTNWKWDINTAKIWNAWGQHNVGVGYTYQRSLYSGSRERSGPRFTIPSENAIGTPTDELGIPDFAAGQQFNVQFRLRAQAAECTLCPLFNVRGTQVPVSLQVFRGEFGPPDFDTRGNYTGGSINSPDGIPDGFADPVRKYKAFEFELNKRFSNNWQLLSNFRVASLRGNYEGHLRNDNGQTDPGISSLFDFTQGDFNLLGDQFQVGYLNTDRRFVSNIYASYAFSKDRTGFNLRALQGLNVGLGFHMESGIPISEYLPHPVYLNAGEVPVGGRGKLGRTPFFSQLDLHADYPWVINDRAKVSFIADFFNVTNNRRLRLPDQFRQLDLGENNPDFLQPSIISLTSGFHLPFSVRLGARFEF
jgi:hypothetical protein